MKKSIIIFLILLLSRINLQAQTAYDTLQDEMIPGCWWEEPFIVKDFRSQLLNYLRKTNFTNIPCKEKTVYISTVFGKEGKLKNTRIVKSAGPECDSIAYHFVTELKDWIPGRSGGHFVDIPFTIPIIFDTSLVEKKYLADAFFNVSEEEYENEKEYLEFIQSDQYDRKMISNYNFFRIFCTDYINEKAGNVIVLENYRLKRKNSILLYLNTPAGKQTHLLVWSLQKKHILYQYDLKTGKVRIPKEKDLLLIIYKEGQPPLLQTRLFFSGKDTVMNLNPEIYTKGRLLKEIDNSLLRMGVENNNH